MYNFDILEGVDSKKWDNELLKSEYATFFQSAVYLTSNSSDSFPLFVYVYDDSGNMVGQLALTIRKTQPTYSTSFLKGYIKLISKLGNRGSWVNGPIIHTKDRDSKMEILRTFIKALDLLSEKYNLMVIDGYSPPQDLSIDDGYVNEFKKNGYKVENFITFVIDLSKNIDEIWHDVKRYMRIAVKRAPKRNVTVKELENRDELKEYYELEKKWAKTKGIELIASHFDFENDWNNKVSMRKIFLAYDNKELISGLQVDYFNGIASPSQVSSSYSKATSLGGPALSWHAIQWAKNSSMKIYDFTGGEALPVDDKKKERYNKQWAGLFTYKRKWGGKEYSHYHFLKVRKKLVYKTFRALSRPDSIYKNFKRNRYKKPMKEEEAD